MNAELTITPESNVDQAAKKVIDLNKVTRITRNWKDNISVFDAKTKQTDIITVKELSLYDHRLILDNGVQHRVLHMLSR